MEGKILNFSSKVLKVVALRCPARFCGEAMKILRPLNVLMNRKGSFKCIIDDVKSDSALKMKLLLLGNEVRSTSLDEIPQDIRDVLVHNNVEAVKYNLVVEPKQLTYEELLAEFIPKEITKPAAFERAGHIAHFNLLEMHYPYKNIIAEAVILKHPNIKTVINKVGEIKNQFRVFPMEVIGGEPNFITTLKEHGNLFRFDFSKVYWNSRLDTEHQRMVDLLPSNAIVWDMFCGVGPFLIPLAKKGCEVHGNDLNPDSILYLKENIILNKINNKKIQSFNLDAREFIRKQATRVIAGEIKMAEHIIMNLPKIGLGFLDVFRGLITEKDNTVLYSLPTIHCYCFSPENDYDSILERMNDAMSSTITVDDVKIHLVRSVAPNKEMYRVSFQVPKSVLFFPVGNKRANTTEEHDVVAKKQKH